MRKILITAAALMLAASMPLSVLADIRSGLASASRKAQADFLNGKYVLMTKNAPLSDSEKYGKLRYKVKLIGNSYKYKKGRTYIRTEFSWNWTAKPSTRGAQDTAAMTTSELFTVTGKSKAVISYMPLGGGRTIRVKVKVSPIYSAKAAQVSVPMTRTFAGKKYYASGGTMSVRWKAYGRVTWTRISGNYGHGITFVDPRTVINSGAVIYFTPKSLVDYGKTAYVDAKFWRKSKGR
ncbi:MAG: hypothetical protein PUB39_03700 [Eubacteriales bacterium]|nr:hypothetical protein [Eubacteriales bacterium]